MTEDRKTSSAERLRGSVKEAIGKLTGDARTETEGRRQKRDASGSKAGGAGPAGAGSTGAGGAGPAGSGHR